MELCQKPFILLLATTAILQVGRAVHIYLKPENLEAECPDATHICITLDQLKKNSSTLLPSGGTVTLTFLSGIHRSYNNQFGVDSLNSLTIESVPSHAAILQYFDGNARFLYIRNISSVIFRNMNILSDNSIPRIEMKDVTNVLLSGSQFTRMNIDVFPSLLSTSSKDITITLIDSCFKNSSFRIEFLKDFKVQQMQLSVVNCRFNQSQKSAVSLITSSQRRPNLMSSFEAFTVNILNVITETSNENSINLQPPKTGKALINIRNCSINGGEHNGVLIIAERRIRDIKIIFVKVEVSSHKANAISIRCKCTAIKLTVLMCTLKNNKYGLHFGNIFDKNLRNGTVEVDILETVAAKNKDTGMYIITTGKSMMKLNITNCLITNTSKVGTAITIRDTKTNQINIQNSRYSQNREGGLTILSTGDSERSEISICNCTISNNYLTSVVNRAIDPQPSSAGLTLWLVQKVTHILIEKVTFLHNRDLSAHPINFQVVNSKNITIKDCEFISNHGSVQSYLGELTFLGHNIFRQNTGYNGGSLSLVQSRMIILNGIQIDFIDNKAAGAGGAIFIQELPKSLTLEGPEKCFYQLPSIRSSKKIATLNSTLNFYNNTAEFGGENIYGAPLKDSCYVSKGSEVYSSEIAKAGNIFQFHSLPQAYYSLISSDPERVCLCDENGSPQCANISYIVQEQTRFPGEKFSLSAVLVGNEFGTVIGTVYATLLHQRNEINHQLDRSQQSQEVTHYKKCNSLNYSINTEPGHQQTLVLTSSRVNIEELPNLKQLQNRINEYIQQQIRAKPGISKELLSQPVFINITLENCPVGFQLDTSSYTCECSKEVKNFGIESCSIINHTGLLYRHGTVWITARNNQSGVIVHIYCHYHYCKVENISVDPTLPDTQCALNHSGILCGGCLANHSLTIGSNRCVLCQNNNHLSLILFFAAAGFLLVLFIKILDLTVSKGSINGLIFNANIAWAYNSVFFPSDISRYPFLQSFLQVFLAWLNLDFGIETCFVTGLTAYWKTWLQFVFPLYVWTIVGCMILFSRYSTRLTNILGNNTVPVLATLFLLSYSKLVRTIITVLGFSVLRYEGHIVSVVWSFDGNLAYFGVEHSFLMLVALLSTLLLWLPYVGTLLLVPCLKRKSHLKCLRWINLWKPFYDAYFGPLKDKHNYWVGLLLIIRGSLLLLFSITSTSYPNLATLIMILTSTFILLYSSFVEQVYKNRFLGLCENLALINLIFLGSGILYVNKNTENKSIIVQISIALTFVHFLSIVTFHIWQKVGIRCWKEKPVISRTESQLVVERNNDNWRGSYELRESLLIDRECDTY